LTVLYDAFNVTRFAALPYYVKINVN